MSVLPPKADFCSAPAHCDDHHNGNAARLLRREVVRNRSCLRGVATPPCVAAIDTTVHGTLSVAWEEVMATEIDRAFHLIKPLVDIQADCTLAAPMPTSGGMATVVIATRHEIAGTGIDALLQASGYSVVARCSREDDLLHCLEAYRPDIIILSESIVGQEATRTVLPLRAHNNPVAIIFLLEGRDSIPIADLLALHVEGILLSTACTRNVIDCVESVHRGRKWVDPELLSHLTMAERAPQNACSLTPREVDIAHLVSQGLRNKEIARELHVFEGTVKMHLHHIYEKLHLDGRTQLALSMFGARAVSGKEARPFKKPARPIPPLWQASSPGANRTTCLSVNRLPRR
jgi:DNA-binding NarL/FixJ family response regulator